jgi:hypothetical protein
MRGRYAVRVTPADAGQRVSVRARTHAPAGEPQTTDAVGVLRAWADGILLVERRDGTVAEIPETDVVAARVIPARAERP